MQGISNVEKKYLFISIRPEFISKILLNQKKIELRKLKPKVNVGDYLIIYVSSPLKSVVAFSMIKKLIDTSPQKMWEKYSSLLGIDKSKFDNYYVGKRRAIGIELENIIQVEPMHLYDIRDVIPNFQPPQIYRYVQDINIFRNLIKNQCIDCSIRKKEDNL